MARKKREKICGIYKIKNMINGKSYIGKSIDIEKRWYNHKYDYIKRNKKDYLLYKSMDKYGFENFSFEILIECEEDLLDLMEIYYIKKYNTYVNWKNSNGYNMTIGGGGTSGYHLPAGKNSASKKVECDGVIFNSVKECSDFYSESYTSMINWLNGKTHIPDEYLKMNLKYVEEKYNKTLIPKSKIVNKKTNSRTIVYDNLEFETLAMLGRFLCEKPSTISAWLKGKVSMPKKYYDKGLRYKNEYNIEYKVQEKEHSYSKPVICNGIEYSSISDFERKNNLKKDQASRWLNKKTKMPKEYIDMDLRFKGGFETDYTYETNKRKEPVKKQKIEHKNKTHGVNSNNKRKTKHVLYNGEEYESVKELCEKNKEFKVGTVRKWLENKKLPKSVYKDKLMYKDDDFSNYTYFGKRAEIICNGIEYGSLKEMAKSIKIDKTKIWDWVKSDSIPYGNEDLHIIVDGKEIKHSKKKSKIKVVCENIIYDTITKCANFYEVSPRNMMRWLTGERRMPQEFVDKGLKYID